MLCKAGNALSTDNRYKHVDGSWNCRIQCCFLLELLELPIINDMHKTDSQFRDKYDIKLNMILNHLSIQKI